MKGICKLCNIEKELRQSHILPEFMYQNLYDPQPKRFYTLSVDLENCDNLKKKIEQKGIRETLFCDTCESLLSKYENYSAETIYAKNKGNKAYITKASQTPDMQYFLYDFAGLSYKEFKIHLLSILYRIIICETFNTPNIADGIEEQLRQAILNENPMDYDDFGCLMQVIKYEKEHIAGGFILDPFITENDNSKVLNILIDGFMYSFYLNSKNLAEEKKESFLRQNGTMKILGCVLFQDKGLFERIKQAFDFFRTIKK